MILKLLSLPASAAALFLVSAAASGAAVIGINFGSDQETTPTDAYTTHNLPSNVTVSSWVNFTGDWSTNTALFTANGATIKLYYDSSNTWNNPGVPTSSASKGYLDDWNYNGGGGSTGNASGATFSLGGLNDWLTATGMTSYQIIVLRSTDTASATFSDIRWAAASDVAGNPPAGWHVDPGAPGNWPVVGDYTGGTVVDGDLFLDAANRLGESASFGGNLDNVIIQGAHTNGGTIRGSIAGVVIVGVPEPSSALLAAGLGLCGLSRRRR